LVFIYAGAGVAFVRAVILRREALAAWREAVGGSFDTGQRRFITDLDLDRARLPPGAARKLIESRRVLVAGSLALMIALFLNFLVLRPR
jgi:hypothetical protein